MIKIAEYSEEDGVEIKQLIEEISKEFDHPISPSDSSDKAKALDKWWLAKKDDVLVGTIGMVRLKGSNGILKSMFVKKELRGKGLSALLLQTAISWSKENKIEAIFLGTMAQFKAAQVFYSKNGFQLIDRTLLPSDFIHNTIDDLYYRIDLKKVKT